MIINEIIYAIREKLKSYTDDTRYTDDYLLYLINLKRSTFLRREYNRPNVTFDEQILQTICLEMELVDSSECPECFINNRCDILRTVKKLPELIDLHSRSVITRVAPIGVTSQPMSIVGRRKFQYVGEDVYQKNTIYGMLHDNKHFYFKSANKFIRTFEWVSFTVLAENPMELSEYSCDSGGTVCYNPDLDKYPVKGHIADVIIATIVEELAGLKQIPEDVINNAKDDI